MQTLLAWVTPAFTSGSPVDHTWVTTYDSRTTKYETIADVIAAGQYNFYCWGDFHPVGKSDSHLGGLIGFANADLGIAACICKPNLDSRSNSEARGTIFIYGIDGVCHQLANQILWSTGINGSTPLSVREARGFRASEAIYGTYGLQHSDWSDLCGKCSTASSSSDVRRRGMTSTDKPKDQFEEHARSVLLGAENAEEKLASIQRLRGELREYQSTAKTRALGATERGGRDLADEINGRNDQFFSAAARLLSPSEFKSLFGFEPSEKIQLVREDVVGKRVR